MSLPSRRESPGPTEYARVFAALGDTTRLALVGKLCGGGRHSISQLADGSAVTRQAITKHLRVLENAGVIRGVRQGRETLFAFEAQPIDSIRAYLDDVSAQWDETLARLKSFAEK